MSETVKPSELRHVASRIRVIADGYEALADEIAAMDLTEFDASGIKTLQTATIDRLEGTLDRNFSRLRKRQRALKTSGIIDPKKIPGVHITTGEQLRAAEERAEYDEQSGKKRPNTGRKKPTPQIKSDSSQKRKSG